MTGVERTAGAEPGDSEREVAELQVKAWRLHNRDNMSVRDVADAMNLSPATAHRWIKKGQAAEVYADLLQRQYRRLDMADRLRVYRAMAIEEYRQGGSAGQGNQKSGAGSFRDLLPALLEIEKVEMRLLGLAMPVQVEHSVAEQHGEAPPAYIVEAAMEAERRDAEKRRAIEQGDGL